MTSIALTLRNDRVTAGVALALGSAALAGRVIGPGSLWILAAAGATGMLLPHSPHAPRLDPRLCLAVGAGAFVAASWASADPPVPIWWWGLAAAVLAGVAEEAFFRRAAYAWLLRWGPGVAVVVTSAAFALVHVRVYGPHILALDFAAGIVLGWQRWASGNWTVPAATHVLANLLMMR
jgi:membrane protease YdiL (CAAX protease family)